MKVCIVGCGLRTPLLLSALFEDGLGVDEIALFDTDPAAAQVMESLGNALRPDAGARLWVAASDEEAVRNAAFVISSVRAGGIASRAMDERVSFEAGIAGQETIGPAGFAMAVRNVPAVLHYARLMESVAPSAWLINLANPASIVTEAVRRFSRVRAVGICDTPQELVHRIAATLSLPVAELQIEYFGLNHLGWIRRIRANGREYIDDLLDDDARLDALYPQRFFDTSLLRQAKLLPTEYLYFYYRRRRAWQRQSAVGRTRGEELALLNRSLFDELRQLIAQGDSRGALDLYAAYLNRRDASYLRSEVEGKSAFQIETARWNPFRAETGYHRIAVAAIRAVSGVESPSRMVLNVPTGGAIERWPAESIAEVSCTIDNGAILPDVIMDIPDHARGLMQSVKAYEVAAIEAAISGDRASLTWALTQNPLVGDWDMASELVKSLEL